MTLRTRVIPGLVVAALAMVQSGGLRAQADKPAARVNGETITVAEVEAVLNARPLQYVKLTEADRREMRSEALDMLIDDLIMEQFLRQSVPMVRASEINEKVKELQTSLRVRGQTMQDYYMETGQTEAQVRAAIVNLLRRRNFLASNVNDAAVRKFFDENRVYFDQDTVRASHILFRLSPSSSRAERQVAEGKLQNLRQEIVTGKVDFAEAAKRYSQCPSAPYGGDIGYFLCKGTVDESFARAAFALNKDEISEVVETKDGLHLIKVTDRKAGEPADFKKIEEKVREIAGAELMLQVLAEQRQRARVEIFLDEAQQGKGNLIGRAAGRTP